MSIESDIQLIDQNLDPEISNDETGFYSGNEVLAYARHLSERDLVDTEANRATWIAARTYYDAELSEEKDKPVITTDREAEQERRLASLEQDAEITARRLNDLQFRLNEDRIKEMALSMAVQGSSGENRTSIVEKAKAFEAFLSGTETSS